MRHAIDGLIDPENRRATVGARHRVAGRRTAVDDLVLKQRPLEIGSNKIPTVHLEAEASGGGGEHAERGGAHGCAEGLIIVDPRALSTALDAKARFQLTAPRLARIRLGQGSKPA